ncbi:MAG: helix-turn-helix transcriptional regulator [Lactobacillus sp.]|nr:helix-turn-helix transcriptional regulator [Lactobacillus sp.]
MLLDRIKQRAKSFDMNLQDVAHETGISQNTIYSWRTKTPRSDKLKQVAELLHTTTDYLNGLTDNPSIPDKSSAEKHELTWQDLDMPYGGSIPDDLKGMYRALAEQYVRDHPDKFKK